MSDIKVIIDVVGTEDMVKATKATQQLENKIKTLATALNKGKINYSQYTTGINQLISKNSQLAGGYRNLQSGVMTYASSLVRSSKQIQATNTMLKANTVAVNSNAAAHTRSTKGMNGTSMAMQQVGYQTGDFLVQIQSGTNAMVAFGQQATQLVGILPMFSQSLGISAGKLVAWSAGLGIAIPLMTAIGAAFMRMGGEAEDSSKGIQNAFKALPDFFSELSANISKPFVDAFEEIEAQYGAMFARLAEIKLRETKEAFATSFTTNVSDVAIQSVPFLERLGSALAPGMVQGNVDAVNKVREENEMLFEQVRLIRGIEDAYLDSVSSAKSMEELRDLTIATEAKLADVSSEAADNFARQAEELGIVSAISEDAAAAQDKNRDAAAATALYYAQMYTQLNESQIAGNKLADEMYEAFLNGEKLNEIDLEGGVNAAALAAGRLAENLGISLASAAEMVRLQQTMVYSGRGPGPQGAVDGQFVPDLALYEKWLEDQKKKPTGQTGQTGEDAAEKLLRQAEASRDLIGLMEEQARYEELLFKMQESNATKREPLNQNELKAYADKIHAIQEQTRVAKEAAEQQNKLADTMAQSLGNGFTAMVEGTKSVKDAFREMARDIVKQLWDVFVMQKIIGSASGGTGIAGAIAGIFQADGGAWNKGVQMYADGGVVGSPTMFGHSGGLGVMGEAGPEAIMPLKRGKNGKLGVQMEGSGESIVIKQSFNFSANGDDSVKRIIATEAPKIAALTQKQILDQRRRGGIMKSTFG